MRFPNANNGIIVSRGFSGCAHFRFASSITDLRAGEEVYSKDGNPHRAFQNGEKKSDEEAASMKSSSEEVANITTPDEESENEEGRPAEMVGPFAQLLQNMCLT